jgi:hypothetical protein
MTGVFANQMGCHLGDLWIFVSAGLRLSEHLGEPVRLEAPRLEREATSLGLIEEIAAQMDSTGQVIASTETPTETFGNLWRRLYLQPTRRRWRPGPHGRIAYQFDGRTLPEKNPPTQDIPRLIDGISRYGTPVKVGLPCTIAESVEILATSDCFVGCASGLAIIAWSVGIPVYYLEYGLPVDRFITGGQRYTKCLGTAGFLQEIGQP